MKQYCLTRKQLYNALQGCGSKYIAVRHWNGDVLGHNVKIALRGLEIGPHIADDKPSRYIGFYPISFQEYIRIKLPLI